MASRIAPYISIGGNVSSGRDRTSAASRSPPLVSEKSDRILPLCEWTQDEDSVELAQRPCDLLEKLTTERGHQANIEARSTDSGTVSVRGVELVFGDKRVSFNIVSRNESDGKQKEVHLDEVNSVNELEQRTGMTVPEMNGRWWLIVILLLVATVVSFGALASHRTELANSTARTRSFRGPAGEALDCAHLIPAC